MTEFNPGLLGPVAPGGQPAGIEGLRAQALALRPKYFRVMVIWSAIQPRPNRPPDWEAPSIGGYSVADQLRAAAAARRSSLGGLETVVTFLGMPAWAARPPGGCEPPRKPDARAIAPSSLPAYRAMLESLMSLAARAGAPIRWWSAWNEPNVNLYLAPQRARCDPASPSLAARQYAPLVRTLKATLDAAPGDQQLVVGETSSPYRARAGITTVTEFVRALPQDVVCAGRVWAHHQYVGDADHLAEVQRLLVARGCPRGAPRIWITETGAGRETPNKRRSPDPGAQRAGCRSLDRLLRRWYRDPRVDAAFQFTFHEDPNFAVGLVTPDYERVYPTYALWRAWGTRPSPAAPPPPLPAACR